MTVISRKLSIKSLGINAKDVLRTIEKNGETVAVAAIYGRASGVRQSENKFDPTKIDNKLLGMFEGVNLLTGETFVGTGLYLPGGIDESIAAMLQSGEDSKTVEFAYTVSIVRDDAIQIGYRYQLSTAMEASNADEMAALRQKALGEENAAPAAKALPAPKKPAKAAK